MKVSMLSIALSLFVSFSASAEMFPVASEELIENHEDLKAHNFSKYNMCIVFTNGYKSHGISYYLLRIICDGKDVAKISYVMSDLSAIERYKVLTLVGSILRYEGALYPVGAINETNDSLIFAAK